MPNFQYTIPYMYDGIDKVTVITKSKGVNPLKLSQTKLELIIQYLENHSKEVNNPKNLALPQHMSILTGLALHEIAQLTSFWNYFRPRDTKDYEHNYLANLHDLSKLAPTADQVVLKRMFHFLNDKRLAMPKVRGTAHFAAKQTIYRLLTDKVLSWLKNQPPFRDTPAFPSLAHHQDLESEIPFPKPQLVTAEWHRPNRFGQTWDQKVIALSDNLLKWHDSRVVLPVDFTLKHGGAMHEVRYSSVYPAHHFIWSGRFDLLYYARQAIPPESIIRLIDFKSGRFSPPGKDSLAYLMLRIATWLNTQTILALPEEFQRGKSIRLFPPIGTTGPNVKIKIDYISLHQFPPVITSLDQYFQDDWLDDGRFITLIGLIDKLVAMIMDQRNRLAPVLGELPDTTTGKFDRWLKSTR